MCFILFLLLNITKDRFTVYETIIRRQIVYGTWNPKKDIMVNFWLFFLSDLEVKSETPKCQWSWIKHVPTNSCSLKPKVLKRGIQEETEIFGNNSSVTSKKHRKNCGPVTHNIKQQGGKTGFLYLGNCMWHSLPSPLTAQRRPVESGLTTTQR